MLKFKMISDEAIECENECEYEQLDDAARVEDFSGMVERVNKWHEMLRPILADCEKRNNFDIHTLGTDIIDMFPQDEEKNQYPTEISFTDVMRNRDETYTARYFLSALLLTNNKNIHLKVIHPEQNGKIVCSKDDIRMKLQSRSRHQDEVNKINQHLNETQTSNYYANINENIIVRSKKPAQKRKQQTN